MIINPNIVLSTKHDDVTAIFTNGIIKFYHKQKMLLSLFDNIDNKAS